MKWLFHNCVGHPICGVVMLFNEEWADWIHDATLPTGEKPSE